MVLFVGRAVGVSCGFGDDGARVAVLPINVRFSNFQGQGVRLLKSHQLHTVHGTNVPKAISMGRDFMYGIA